MEIWLYDPDASTIPFPGLDLWMILEAMDGHLDLPTPERPFAPIEAAIEAAIEAIRQGRMVTRAYGACLPFATCAADAAPSFSRGGHGSTNHAVRFAPSTLRMA